MIELSNFYKAIQAWIDNDCKPEGGTFVTRWGLCANLERFFSFEPNVASGENRTRYLDILRKSFMEAELDGYTPFNEDEQDYENEAFHRLLYKNPQRLKWVKDHAN